MAGPEARQLAGATALAVTLDSSDSAVSKGSAVATIISPRTTKRPLGH